MCITYVYRHKPRGTTRGLPCNGVGCMLRRRTGAVEIRMLDQRVADEYGCPSVGIVSNCDPSVLPTMLRNWLAADTFWLWLSPELRDELSIQADEWAPLETGGILLGYRDDESATLMMTTIVGPGPNADHKVDSFVPDAKWQEREISRLYAASGRRIEYLGDWHTHPTGSSLMSRRDRRTLKTISKSRTARARRPLMVVVSRGEPVWNIHAYRLNGRRTEQGVLVEANSARKA